MIKKNLLFALLICTLSTAYAEQQESDTIHVHLSTEAQLIPIYLAKFVEDNSGIPKNMIERLEQTLRFDLNHNGMTNTVRQTADQENWAHKLPTISNEGSKAWKTAHLFYVIKIDINSNKQLVATLFSVNGNISRRIQGIALTGQLDEDRKLIHQLADAVYKTLFEQDGIATTHLLYSIKKKIGDKWISEIWEADYDGENARQVTHDQGYSITPVYIPPENGKKSGGFFYVSYKSAQPKIYVASLKDGTARRLSSLSGNQLMPAISKQRDKVAFISDVTTNPDLFLQPFSIDSGAIGKPQQIFASRKSSQGSPCFNPEGNRLAFVSNKDGSPRIYVMEIPLPGADLKDIKVQLVTKHSQESSAPSWSPDGTKLAYCAFTKGVRQIWVYNFNTGEERQLTRGSGNKENPTWSPNSLNLVYNSSDSDASDLYLINLNQPDPVKITSGPGEKRFPSWEPR